MLLFSVRGRLSMAVSLALVVQALLFGDGGVTAIGANCLNMAVMMPFAGWGVYRLIVRRAPAESPRHRMGAAIGGYVGLNAAAVTAAVMFGIQPLIAHDAIGRALYNPYGLSVALPAMAAGHLLVFGFVEAAVTGLVVAYVQRTDPTLLPCAAGASGSDETERTGRPFPARLMAGMAALIVLTPLGLYLPARFSAGSAWGEWSSAEIGKLIGYVPEGMRRAGSMWQAPMPDYALRGHAVIAVCFVCLVEFDRRRSYRGSGVGSAKTTVGKGLR